MRIIFDTHMQARRGRGSSHEPATREQGSVDICDSRRGRSFDVGVKTQRPHRGTHAETLRDREQSETNQRRRVRKVQNRHRHPHKVSEEVWDPSARVSLGFYGENGGNGALNTI